MIEEIRGYVVCCDICEDELGYDGMTSVFDSEKEAREIALENGWQEIEPGKWACEDCAEEIESKTE